MLQTIQHVNYGSKSIQYKLSFAARKSLGIKVLPDGLVTVVAPNEASIVEINKKVKSKANWIIKQQAFFYSYMPKTQKRQFVSGETHLYLGRQYKMEICKDNFNEIKLYRGKMIITTKKINPEYLEKILNELRIEGIEESKIKALHAPIGIQIKSQTPEEIATITEPKLELVFEADGVIIK